MDDDDDELTWKSLAASVVEHSASVSASTQASLAHPRASEGQEDAQQHQDVTGAHHHPSRHQLQQQHHHHALVDDDFSKLDDLTVSYAAAEALEPHHESNGTSSGVTSAAATAEQVEQALQLQQVLEQHQRQQQQQQQQQQRQEDQSVKMSLTDPVVTMAAAPTSVATTAPMRSTSTSSSPSSSAAFIPRISTSSSTIRASSAPCSSTNNSRRIKRKNFSKKLQLLCLTEYAEFAKQNGKLPDKKKCQQMLETCYMAFLKDGGTTDEPKLSYQEFLKLIRNRRREKNVLTQKLKYSDMQTTKLTPAKQKLHQDQAKINELISIIDQIRERTGLSSQVSTSAASSDIVTVSPHATFVTTSTMPSVSTSASVNAAVESLTSSASVDVAVAAAAEAAAASAAVMSLPTAPSPRLVSPMTQPATTTPPPSEPIDPIKLILSIQQETLQIQQEIHRRLANIRNHPSLQPDDPNGQDDQSKDDGMEPSSASV